jgi:hypothetical protein
MKHLASKDDQDFRFKVETCQFPGEAFNHYAHIRLAYIYLTEYPIDTAYQFMRKTLLTFLDHHKVDKSKYHDTMTRAWIMAVRHFMEMTSNSASAANFIKKNPTLLDTKIMLTHYSADVLFSAKARATFIEPNLSPIPRQA